MVGLNKTTKQSGLNSESRASVLVALIALINMQVKLNRGFVKANQWYTYNAELAQNQQKVNVTELC